MHCNTQQGRTGDIQGNPVMKAWLTVMPSIVYDRYRNLNWLILLADTITNTETTFQRENLVTNSMGYFSIIKEPLKPNLLQNFQDF